ncbi:MAG TPA: heme exporter protein CcmB [Deinococcales bacterium]|nr:heme exporter protein CcmB [Deinococcales bacterium]
MKPAATREAAAEAPAPAARYSGPRAALAVAVKDWRVEGRAREVLAATLFFALLVLVILGFAFGPDPARLRAAGPGILWVAISFASILAAGRAYAQEVEDGALETLLLYPVAHEWLYLGKLAGNLGLMLLLALVIAPVTAIVYDLPLGGHWPAYLGLVALGTTGLSIVTTFHSALTVNLRARESLLPILVFPLVVPVVLGAVKATAALAGLAPLGDAASWANLLAVFCVVYTTVCTLVFPFAVEG